MIRALGVLCGFVMMAPVAMAEPLPQGCFARDYSLEHLATHPDQEVARMVLWADIATDGEYPAEAVLAVWMADQSPYTPGQRMDGWFLCEQGKCSNEGASGAACDAQRDRGGFTVTGFDKGTAGTSDAVLITTDFLLVKSRDNCAVEADLAETPGKPTTYRLLRVNEAVCQRAGQ